MNKHIIHLQPLEKTLTVQHQTPLIDVLHEFGVEFPCGGKGTCGKCKVKLLDGEIDISDIHQQKLNLLGLDTNWRLACLSTCTDNITLEIDQYNHMILADESDFDFTPQEGFGVAIDLGTTTLVAQLIDLTTAQVLAVETALNPQVKFGSDIISRIQAYMEGNAQEMKRIIRFDAGALIEVMLKKHNVPLRKIAIVGNTVMHHIFCGYDLNSLAQYPFYTPFLESDIFTASELNWNFHVEGNIKFYPSIGSFVGSDILAGIAATGMYKNDNIIALIDLGTNGEIVVGNKKQLICASTAAGPAFEGANISIGMRAVTGAISSFQYIDNKIVAKTIGKVQPKGICGSALVDAIAILADTGRIGMFGEILSEEAGIELVEGITLTQKDINEFQLAKAAIATGIEILCQKMSLKISDIDKIYIAGGFGNYINTANVVKTGMIELPEFKIHKMGNSALIGAKMFLFQSSEIVENIISKTTQINLESHPDFQNIFVDKMMF